MKSIITEYASCILALVQVALVFMIFGRLLFSPSALFAQLLRVVLMEI